MEPERIFPDDYLPNAEGVPYHQKWERSNPGEALRWRAFRDAVLGYEAGDAVPAPSMSTKYGRALVAAGRSHMSVIDLGTVWNPEPPPPPPPDPHDVSFTRLSDFGGVFNWHAPAQSGWYTSPGTPFANGGGASEFIDPIHGEGIRFCATAEMYAWGDTASKICAGAHDWSSIVGHWVGEHQVWDFYIRFSSTNTGTPGSWWGHAVLLEFVCPGVVGNELFLNPDGELVFAIRTSQTQHPDPNAEYGLGTPVPYDEWIKVRWEVLHSTGADGINKGWINDQLVMNRSGPTMFGNEYIRYLQVGWYQPAEGKHTVDFAGMGYTIL